MIALIAALTGAILFIAREEAADLIAGLLSRFRR
jgi:hypothetical protein